MSSVVFTVYSDIEKDETRICSSRSSSERRVMIDPENTEAIKGFRLGSRLKLFLDPGVAGESLQASFRLRHGAAGVLGEDFVVSVREMVPLDVVLSLLKHLCNVRCQLHFKPSRAKASMQSGQV